MAHQQHLFVLGVLSPKAEHRLSCAHWGEPQRGLRAGTRTWDSRPARSRQSSCLPWEESCTGRWSWSPGHWSRLVSLCAGGDLLKRAVQRTCVGRSVTSNVSLLPDPHRQQSSGRPLRRRVSLGQGEGELTPALLVGEDGGCHGSREQLGRELFLVGGEAPERRLAALRGESKSPSLGLGLLGLGTAREARRDRGSSPCSSAELQPGLSAPRVPILSPPSFFVSTVCG